MVGSLTPRVVFAQAIAADAPGGRRRTAPGSLLPGPGSPGFSTEAQLALHMDEIATLSIKVGALKVELAQRAQREARMRAELEALQRQAGIPAPPVKQGSRLSRNLRKVREDICID